MDSDLVLTECLSRRILRLTASPFDFIHSERVSSSTSSFLAHCQAYTSHASMKISKFWCHENETGSLNFGPLRKRSLSYSFRTIIIPNVVYTKILLVELIHFRSMWMRLWMADTDGW